MKIIARTLIILAAGLLVTGALFAFAQSGLASQMRAAGPRSEHVERGEGQAAGLPGRPEGGLAGHARPEGGFAGRGERGDHHGPSLLGFVTLVESLAKIGALVALVAIGARLLALRRRDRSGRDGPAPTTRPTTRL